MMERLLERQALSYADYRALDRDPHAPEAAQTRLQAWAAARRLGWETEGERRWRIHGAEVDVVLEWTTGSLFDAIELPSDRDLVVAHAFLDLVDLERALPLLFATLNPGGLFYFTHTFDGLTAFLPEIDAALDEAVINAYHDSMDLRREDGRPTAGSRAGRRLLQELHGRGARLLDIGSSDWIVFPKPGGYEQEEEAFLNAMVDFVEGAVGDDPRIDPGTLRRWVERRRSQIRSAELTFLAHQIDIVGRIGTAG
ncbi:MAG TPA: hypothetical protein VLL77_03415 [Anaerolineales bacterium]|nr:hypothetical protein [Anaerolineales bacterium]